MKICNTYVKKDTITLGRVIRSSQHIGIFTKDFPYKF